MNFTYKNLKVIYNAPNKVLREENYLWVEMN